MRVDAAAARLGRTAILLIASSLIGALLFGCRGSGSPGRAPGAGSGGVVDTAVASAPSSGQPAPSSRPGPIAAAWSGLRACPAVELRAFSCGQLSVPLDRARPVGSGALRLPVIVGGRLDAPRTLLFLSGGPGQPGVSLLPRTLNRYLNGVPSGYRVVMLDQRGTGANALDCPRLQQALGSSDLEIPEVSAVTDCAARIGAARQFYATTATVADLEDLRAALRVPRWSINGISYGSYVAQRYAAAYPQRVDKLLLDSVVPVTGFDPLLVDQFAEIARVLRDACAARGCRGDPIAQIAKVLARSPDLQPGLVDVIVTMSVIDPTFGSLLGTLPDAAAGSEAGLRRTLVGWQGGTTPADQLSQGLHAATLCLDIDFPWGQADATPTVRSAAMARSVAGVPATAVAPFRVELLAANGLVVTCQAWPQTPDPLVRSTRVTVPGSRVLLLAGERDLSTPLSWAQRTRRAIPGSRLVVVPDGGHAAQRDPVGQAAARAFLQGR